MRRKQTLKNSTKLCLNHVVNFWTFVFYDPTFWLDLHRLDARPIFLSLLVPEPPSVSLPRPYALPSYLRVLSCSLQTHPGTAPHPCSPRQSKHGTRLPRSDGHRGRQAPRPR